MNFATFAIPRRVTAFASIVIAGLFHPNVSQAAVLVTYDIAAANAAVDSTLTPTAASGITAGDLSLTGVTPVSISGSFAATGWGVDPTPDLGKYIEFTVTPTTGNQITFGTLDGTFWRAAGNPVATFHAADKFELRSSADSFGSTIGSVADLLHTGDAVQTALSFDLSSLGTRSQGTTFRLYGYNEANPFNAGLGNSVSLDGTGGNLFLNGTVSPVPEPYSIALVTAFGLFGFGLIRRRTPRR